MFLNNFDTIFSAGNQYLSFIIRPNPALERQKPFKDWEMGFNAIFTQRIRLSQ